VTAAQRLITHHLTPKVMNVGSASNFVNVSTPPSFLLHDFALFLAHARL